MGPRLPQFTKVGSEPGLLMHNFAAQIQTASGTMQRSNL